MKRWISGDSLESIGNVGSSDRVLVHPASHYARIVKWLIDDIPSVDLSLIVRDFVLNVRLEDGNEGCIVEATAGDPRGELCVPALLFGLVVKQGSFMGKHGTYKIVATDNHVVALGKIENGITLGVGVGVLGGFGRALSRILSVRVHRNVGERTHFMLFPGVICPNIPPVRRLI